MRYKKSKDKDAYLRRHETELLLHDGAENMLKRFGIDLRTLDVEKLRGEYNALYSKKETLQKTYKSAEREAADLKRKLDNLNQYLDRSLEQQSADKKIDKIPNPSKFDIKKRVPQRVFSLLRYPLMWAGFIFCTTLYFMPCTPPVSFFHVSYSISQSFPAVFHAQFPETFFRKAGKIQKFASGFLLLSVLPSILSDR